MARDLSEMRIRDVTRNLIGSGKMSANDISAFDVIMRKAY